MTRAARLIAAPTGRLTAPGAGLDLGARDLDGAGRARRRQLVEAPRVGHERAIAAAADVGDDRRDALHERGVVGRIDGQQAAERARIRCGDDLQHGSIRYITILLSGYSTMPSAPAALRRGMRSRTVRSSRIVLSATQSPSASGEMVGRRSAGSRPRMRGEVVAPRVQHDADAALRGDRGLQQQRDVLELLALRRIDPARRGWRSAGCSTPSRCR